MSCLEGVDIYVKEIDVLQMELVNNWIDDVISIFRKWTNGLIDLSDQRLQLGFMFMRFGGNVVSETLFELPTVIRKEEIIPTLMKLCQEKFRNMREFWGD